MAKDKQWEFRCPKCRKKLRRDGYAIAHYNMDLQGKCEFCGARLLLPANYDKVRLA